MKKVYILVVFLMSFNALSDDYNHLSWDLETNTAMTLHDDDVMEVRVAMSGDGKQRIYIDTHVYVGSVSGCTSKGEGHFENSTLNIYGVNVKTILYCQKDNSGNLFYSETAATIKGEAYILKQFRKSKPVIIDGFSIFSKGFQKVWDSFGGDAI